MRERESEIQRHSFTDRRRSRDNENNRDADCNAINKSKHCLQRLNNIDKEQ